MTTWDNGWPDWKDAGKTVEIEQEDGTTVTGKLIVDDYGVVDDGDEYPIFKIKDRDGTIHSFALHKNWRFTEGRTP